MTLFIVILCLLLCSGIRFSGFHDDYMSVPKTTSIKGVFAVLILLSHVRGYGVYASSDPGTLLLSFLGQMIVVMYFFYSGFGIAEQYKKRGDDYVRSFPLKRIFKTLLHFDVAVLLFIIVQTVLGHRFQFSDYLLSFVGWSSVGNSNWFVFDIMVLYSLTWIAFRLSARHAFSQSGFCLLLSGFTLLFWLFLYLSRQGEPWWVNTISAFPFGFWYSKEKQRVDTILKDHPLLAFIPMAVWVIWRLSIGVDVLGISALLFAVCVAALTTKVALDNKALRWLGSNCFEIYILQRLPMILLESFGIQRKEFLFTTLVIAMTLIIADLFHRGLYALDRNLALT